MHINYFGLIIPKGINLLIKSAFVLFLIAIYFPLVTASAQESEIKIGQDVVVKTNGQNLNLRQGPGTSFSVIAKLPEGAILTVIGGPEVSDGYLWWEVKGNQGRGWTAGDFLKLVSSAGNTTVQTSPINKQSDWRGNLSCNPKQRVFEGVLYCTGMDEFNNTVHVLIADLMTTDIKFEYILPEGRSDGHEGMKECRDPNVPAWGGPAKGCHVNRNRDLYPVMKLYAPTEKEIQDAVDRARDIRKSPLLAAVINGDYAASSQTHGPEGLIVVRGTRLDGANNCDDDYNAALRPWLGLGNGLNQELGLIQAEINRLDRDSSPIKNWIYTGIGGGPWLIRDGDIVDGSTTCTGEKVLQTLDPIMNCSDHQKSEKYPPLKEIYTSGSCRTTFQTAAGLSKDYRWLFLVLTTSKGNPEIIANFMKDKLGVWQAIKFDGGGSSQMLYNPEQPLYINPNTTQYDEARSLTNYLAIYAQGGNGIHLPLQAHPMERIYYQVVNSGEKAIVRIKIENTGEFTWHPDDQVELREEPWFLVSPVLDSLPLPSPVGPGEIAIWNWEINTDGYLVRRFQMYQRNEPFGPEFAVVIGVLPEGWATDTDELEAQIQEIIDKWESKGEEELDGLIDQLEDWFLAQIGNWFERTVYNLTHSLDELAQSSCQNSVIIFGLLLAVIFHRNKRY